MRWFLLFLIASVIWVEAKEDFSFSLAETKDKALVDLPSNWEPGKRYPALFYYHGTNGKPQTQLARRHTGDEDWIVVGMPYAQRGLLQWEKERVALESKVLRAVRDRLVAEAGLNEKQVYLSGFSKGGWFAGLLMQEEEWVAGAAVMGAGHIKPLENISSSLVRNKPIFIGVGRLDRNYTYSLRAKVYFRKRGAKVEMEEWPDLGHRFPREGSVGLKEWLALRLGKQVDQEALEKEWQEIAEMKGYEQWLQLRLFHDRPFVQAANWQKKIADVQKKIEAEPTIAREVRILKESRRLLGKEIGKRTYQDLKTIADGYESIVKGAGESPQGKVAQHDFARAAEIWKIAQQQRGVVEEKAREVKKPGSTFGTGGSTRTRPSNPLFR